MKSQLTDREEEDLGKRSRSMANKLVVMVNGYAVDRNRARGLVLLADREAEKMSRPMSKVNTYDRPEIELILHHRDCYLRFERLIVSAELAIESAKKQIIDGTPEFIVALSTALGEIGRLEAQRTKHLTAMETILATLTKEMGTQEGIMARLAADAQHLAQKASEHRDKMDLARKSADIPTTGELKARLALKYGVPVEQVEAILAAKSVEAEQIDG